MSPLETGRQIAHYRVEGRLGAGGMGEVYKARDIKLGRLVALKLLPSLTGADPTARRRLLEEARAAAALTHPNIVTIYSVDEEDGSDFIVMECVEGESLQQRLEDGPLPVPELIRLGIEVADALGAAHAIGLVHRDIKPSNILLTKDGVAKVLDFGIAKRIEGTEAGRDDGTVTNLTGAGMIVGTAAYMAPEQARGETLDGRADIFSLGATLYEAATGRKAFVGATALDTMVAVASKEPPNASLIRPDLPSDLDVILSRALAKKRGERYETPRQLADALRGLREGSEGYSGTLGEIRVAPISFPHNLPTPLTSFIGRSRERGEVRRLLGSGRMITILGPGGSGKTRLAIQVAKEGLGDFPDGAWLAELEAIADPALVPQQVARALGIQEEPETPIAKTLSTQLVGKALLLVLDNCEHVAASVAPLVAAILGAAPNVRVIATSREALGVPGEISWRIPTLSVPDPRTSVIRTKEAAGRFEAVRLFVDRAQAAQPAFALQDKNAATVAQICHRLDGIPLAIELAAVRVKVLPVEQILTRLQDRFALLTGGSRTALPRQQTLRAAVDWSYDLLSEPEKKLLNRVSVFAGGFSLDSAESVCAWNGLGSMDVLDLLSPLVDKSLVVPHEVGETARYSLLETIRDYAAERLKQAGEQPTQEERHAVYFFDLAIEAAPELQGPDQAAWFDRLESEHDNLRRAARSFTARRDRDHSLRLAVAVWRFWYMRGYWEEGRATLREALSLDPEAAGGADRAASLYASAVLAQCQGDLAGADGYLSESLAISRSLGDKQGIGNALFEQGNLANAREDLTRALDLYEEALAIRREIGDKRGVSIAVHSLAVVAQSRGDATIAIRLFEEALGLHRALGNVALEASSLNGLSDVALHAGDLDAARGYIERALVIQRKLGNKGGIGFSLRQLADIATRQNDVPRARDLLREGLFVLREISDSQSLLDIIDTVAAFAARIGAAEGALTLVGAAGSWRAAAEIPRAEPDQVDFIRALAPALEALEESKAAAARARGAAMTPEEALQLAQEIVGGEG